MHRVVRSRSIPAIDVERVERDLEEVVAVGHAGHVDPLAVVDGVVDVGAADVDALVKPQPLPGCPGRVVAGQRVLLLAVGQREAVERC